MDDWHQEYDCPIQRADTDLIGVAMVCLGQRFYCHWCGGEHVAGQDVHISMGRYVGGDYEEREIPATEQELRALL